MDTNYSKFFQWLKKLPPWQRVFVLLAIAVIALFVSMSTSACGTPKTIATVQNVNPNSTVSVTMTVSNSNTSSPTVEVTPSVNPSNLLN